MKRLLSKKYLWENSPPWLKATLGKGMRLMPPAWLLGKRFREKHAFALEAQWWSAEQSREYQLARLRKILQLAYEKTKFYRHALDSVGFSPGDLGTLEDLCRLPVIDRDIIQQNSRDMLTRPVHARDVNYVSTGGTSGTPLHFYISADVSSTEYAYLTASWQRARYNLDIPMAVLRGRTVHSGQNGLRHEYDPILRHHFYSSFHLSEENMGRYLEHITQIGPCFLHVYPSTIAALARFVIRNRTHVLGDIKGIIAESEIVYPQQRQMVEEVFGCRYFSCYGHSEKLVLAAECEQSEDYHVWPTYGFFELLDDNDRPVTTPGQRGEIVGTGFMSTAMPFIRYRTGDWATYVSDRCAECGREHIIIRNILGHRIQESLVATDGSEIPWTALNMHDNTFVHVRQFQFMQETPGRAVLKIVPASEFGNEDTERIYRNLRRKLTDQLTLGVELVDAIPLSPRGKAIYVDQRITNTSSKEDGKIRREDQSREGIVMQECHDN